MEIRKIYEKVMIKPPQRGCPAIGDDYNLRKGECAFIRDKENLRKGDD